MPKLDTLGTASLRTHAETVRENARELLAEAKGAKQFAERTGLSESRVSQLLGKNPSKNIGPSTARRIERAFGKPVGWLDATQDSRAHSSSVGDRLDLAMREAGHASQAALARASGVPQPTIARILKGTGRGGPETETIRKLAGACNVDFSWLNDGSRAPDRSQDPLPQAIELLQLFHTASPAARKVILEAAKVAVQADA